MRNRMPASPKQPSRASLRPWFLGSAGAPTIDRCCCQCAWTEVLSALQGAGPVALVLPGPIVASEATRILAAGLALGSDWSLQATVSSCGIDESLHWNAVGGPLQVHASLRRAPTGAVAHQPRRRRHPAAGRCRFPHARVGLVASHPPRSGTRSGLDEPRTSATIAGLASNSCTGAKGCSLRCAVAGDRASPSRRRPPGCGHRVWPCKGQRRPRAADRPPRASRATGRRCRC